jgi:hypothetical protein
MAVVALEIQTREPVLGGAPFGAAGAYEKVTGIVRLAVDPALPVHAAIADLDRAPRSAAGLVEAWADFYLLRPLGGGNRRLLLDVPNRGRKMALALFNSVARSNDPSTAADFGNGFLLRHGWTVAWVGWQHDVPREDGMMALAVPRVPGVSGRVRCEFRPNARVPVRPLADRYHVPQPVARLDAPDSALTVREHAGAAPVEVPRDEWRFARLDGDRLVPDPAHVWLRGGFEPGKIYACSYRAEDPPLVGLGFAAVRDAAAFLRFGGQAGGNPCAGGLDRAFVFGISQSGRFLRHLLYLGLDEDEHGRMVFDGVMPHVAGARRGEFNLRFGQPSLNATASVGSLFPFTDGPQDDPLTGQRGALLQRLRARGRQPRIVTINNASEYWRGDASLVHIDVLGKGDVALPDGVRVYLHAGTQHTPGSIPPPAADPNTGDRGRHPFNPVDYTPLLRAALVNLERWVSEGVEPPPSAVPRVADGTAVAAETTRAVFEAIPGARFPDRVTRPARLDFGPDVERGVAAVPPATGAPYATFVPAVDADGNDVAGVQPWELRAPLATFTGWNLRHPDQGAPGDLMSMMGSSFPFPPTAEARARARDPRRSLEERYRGREDYRARVRAVAEAMVRERHLLPEDVAACVERAGVLWDHVGQTYTAG